MKFCTHCGKELLDEAVICPNCGCGVNYAKTTSGQQKDIVAQLSEKVKINAIIWFVIAGIQIFLGLYIQWVFLIIGVLNIVTAVQDMNFSKNIIDNPVGIVAKFKPLTVPILILIYNVIFGGIIGVVGSIYYLVGIRNFVLSNELEFINVEQMSNATK